MTDVRTLDAASLRQLALDCGADDAGLVQVERPELEPDRADILRYFPWTKMLLAFAVRVSRESVRSPARSVAGLEMQAGESDIDEIGRRIVRRLEGQGVRAVNHAAAFPLELDRFPGKIWIVAHKTVAVEAGLGHLGVHRNLIHPKFGDFVGLGTVLVGSAATEYGRPLAENPCVKCMLCVAVCPTGAISADGYFDFSACYSHTYREQLSGFTDWVERITESKDAEEYRKQVSESDTASMWQSLSTGARGRCGYCVAVCPAGEDVIGQYLADRAAYAREVVRPLQAKVESVYVVRGSDAELSVAKRFPHKRALRIGNALRPRTVEQFLSGLRAVFQRGKSEGLDATYHFTFTEPVAKKRPGGMAEEVEPGAMPGMLAGETARGETSVPHLGGLHTGGTPVPRGGKAGPLAKTKPKPKRFGSVEVGRATVVIRNKTVTVQGGHVGKADLEIVADAETWLGFLAKERSLAWAWLTRRIKLKGSAKWLLVFGKCFPS